MSITQSNSLYIGNLSSNIEEVYFLFLNLLFRKIYLHFSHKLEVYQQLKYVEMQYFIYYI